MNKTYIVLLQNKYLLFFAKKPERRGKYTAKVRLFETDESSTCQDVSKWVKNGYKLPSIEEVEDWK